MAQIANLSEPYTTPEPTPAIQPLPVGALVDVEPMVVHAGVVSTITNRFPTPPSATAFLVDPFAESDLALELGAIYGPNIVGALSPAGPYLEPTIGQIWPRTG
jgi:hypothetical protein